MDLITCLLDSWVRQAKIVDGVAERITERNKHAKPSPDGMPLYEQLAHIHKVRHYFLGQLDADLAKTLPNAYRSGWSDPVDDLDAVRGMLQESAAAVRLAVGKALESGGEAGWYSNPILYLQHMIWHEGWHVGLIFLGLRLNGDEPPEEWEEANVWGQWRTEAW